MAAYIYTFHPLTIILSVTWSSLYLSLHIKHVCIYLSLFFVHLSLFFLLFSSPSSFWLWQTCMNLNEQSLSLSPSFFCSFSFLLSFPFLFSPFFFLSVLATMNWTSWTKKTSERHQSPTVEEKEWHWGAHLGRRGCPAHIDMCLVHLNGAWYDSSLQN